MKSPKWKSFWIANVITALMLQILPAVEITIRQDVDLTATPIWVGPPNQFFRQFSSVTPIRISEGDSVDLTYRFLNGRLSMSNSSVSPSSYELAYPWLALLDSPGGGFVISDIQITFLDAVVTGGAQSYFTQDREANGSINLGPSLSNFLPPGASLSFSGITTHYTVDYIEIGGTGLYQPWLIFAADRLVVIPEPSVTALVMVMLLCGRVMHRLR